MNRSKEFELFFNGLDLDYSELKNKTVFVSGALGMLASNLVDTLMYLNFHQGFNIKLILLARSKDRMIKRFGSENSHLTYVIQDISAPLDISTKVDYIFHAAGNSSPLYIKSEPLGIIQANVQGSLNVVDFAKRSNAKKVIFFSTREVYGKVEGIYSISENDFGTFDPLDPRSCYPESKRMAENIFKSASIQYGIDFSIVRVAHSYGPSMKLSDMRVMSDFIGNFVEERDVELLSDGTALRSFCYVLDSISALLFILLKGNPNEAFNIANEDEEISIYELAKLIISIGEKDLNVTRVEPKMEELYCNYQRVKLDTSKLEGLGWKPMFNLETGLKLTLDSFKVEN